MKKTLLSLFAAFGMLASVCAENVSVIVDKADYTEDPQITGFAITDKNDILTVRVRPHWNTVHTAMVFGR